MAETIELLGLDGRAMSPRDIAETLTESVLRIAARMRPLSIPSNTPRHKGATGPRMM